MDDELVAIAAKYFADQCEKSGHALTVSNGGSCRCRELANRLERDRQVRFDAETYDISKLLMRVDGLNAFPTIEWPFAALMRMVVDEILEPPWLSGNSAKRMVRVTSGLARIGECGLPPDALVRIGLNRKIRLALSSFVTASYNQRSRSSVKFPDDLTEWLEAADSSLREYVPDQHYSSEESRLFALVPAMHSGSFAKNVNEWLANSSMRDIVAWRYSAEPHGPLDEEDLNIRGGHEAIHWIVDRFTVTHYADWHRPSLYWELRFASSPEATANEAGMPLSLLMQRPAHTGLLVESIVSRASYALDHEKLIGDISRGELHAHILGLLQRRFVDQAVDVLRAVLDSYPQLVFVRSMLGFCLIATNPREAIEVISRCKPTIEAPAQLLSVNRAAALWRSGGVRQAAGILSEIETSVRDDGYILWLPEDIGKQSNPLLCRIGQFTLRKWIDQAMALMRQQ